MATIEFTCPACGRKLGVDSSYAGKPGTCPGCGNKVQIPAAPASEPSPATGGGPARRPPRSIRPAAPRTRSSRARRSGGPRQQPSEKRKQQLLLVGGGVAALAVIVVAALLVFLGGGAGSSDLLRLVPADAHSVGYVNLGELADAGFVDAVLKSERNAVFLPVLENAKLDPNKDFSEAVFVGDESGRPTFVVSGRFDAEAIYQAARDAGQGTDAEYRGYAVIEDTDGDYLAVVNNGTLLVAGYRPVARKVLDLLKGEGKAIAGDSPLLTRARKAGGKTFWVSLEVPRSEGSGGQISPHVMLPGVDAGKLEYVVMCGSVRRKSADVTVVMGCSDAEAARATASGVEEAVKAFGGMMTMMTMTGADDADAAEAISGVLNSIKVRPDGNTATITLSLAADDLAAFAKISSGSTPHTPEEVPPATGQPAPAAAEDPFAMDEPEGPPPIKSGGGDIDLEE